MDLCRRKDDAGATLVVALFPTDDGNADKVPALRVLSVGQGHAMRKTGQPQGSPPTAGNVGGRRFSARSGSAAGGGGFCMSFQGYFVLPKGRHADRVPFRPGEKLIKIESA